MKSYRLISFYLLIICNLLNYNTTAQNTVVIQPGPDTGMDTYINSAYPNDPGGPNEGLSANAWTYDGVFGIGRSLIRFDLAGLPTNTQILDARLTLVFDPSIAFGQQYGENASILQKITSPWNAETTTWNNQPGSTTSDQVFIPKTLSASQSLSNINLTEMVQGWVQNPATNFGFIHKMLVENEYCCVFYASSNKPVIEMRPKLVVTYQCDLPKAGFQYYVQLPKVTFTDTSYSATSWKWDFGDGYLSTVQNPVHEYENQGNYNVCLIVQNSCEFDTVCRNIKVCKMPEPSYNYSINANKQLISFSDSSNQPLSWFWDFGDGFYSDLQNPQHYFNKPGIYFVCEHVINACGEDSCCDSIRINATGLNNDNLLASIHYYPNPVHTHLFIKSDIHFSRKTTITLKTIEGKKIRDWNFDGEEILTGISLDLSTISQGLYFLQIQNDPLLFSEKVIIQ